MAKRHSRSSITQLDPDIQAEVSRLVREGWTIDSIKTALAELGADVSRSALGRHVKDARQSMEAYSRAQEMSKVWMERLDAEPNGDVGRLLTGMLQAVAFKSIDEMAETEAEDIDPKAVGVLAKALKDLSTTSKDAFAIARARKDARAQAQADLLAEQAKKLDAMPAAAGVTAATKAAIRDALGIS